MFLFETSHDLPLNHQKRDNINIVLNKLIIMHITRIYLILILILDRLHGLAMLSFHKILQIDNYIT